MATQVDDLMAELGLSVGDQAAPANDGPSDAEIDALLAETTGAAPAKPAMSAGPGAMSAGPGAMSSGPGGMSMGPGGMAFGPGGMAYGPGAMAKARGAGMQSGPKASGPGVGLNVGADGQLTKQTPDGRTTTFTGPACATCGDPVIGRVVAALGKQYHPECFLCVACNKAFPGGAFTEHNGEPYCDECYDNLMAPSCANCGQPVLDQVIRMGGKYYHPAHFTCSGCGTELVGKKYKEDEGEPFCLQCKELNKKLVIPDQGVCARCKLPIQGDFITLRGQRMHPHHFQCEECGAAFTGGNCHEYEGKLYCHDDYLKLLRETCGACHKPIVGRSVTAMGKVWHPDHFVCFTCKEPFAGSQYREHGGNAYCDMCYFKQFGNVCARCNKPVTTAGTLTFAGKTYHPPCFQCTGCEKYDSVVADTLSRPLAGESPTSVETNPYCHKCYKALPKEIRKKVEKKKKQEHNANKQLSKQARK